MSVREKTISGLFWTFGQQFLTVLINFVVSVVLARLMLPSQFGLVGMIAVFISVGEALMNGGLANSLIRTEHPDQRDYSTVFFANLGASLIIYGAVSLTAPLIARFFHEPVLVGLIRVYMACIVLFAFSAVPVAKLTKDLDFKSLLFYRIPALIISGTVGTLMAYKGYGAWSLVIMSLVQAFLYSAILWYKSGWLPSLPLDIVRLKGHFDFGSKLVLSAVLDRLYANAYNLVIGRFYSPTQLGYYARSNTLVQVPTVNLYEALNKVSYPVLSAIQNEKEKLALVYKRMMHQALFITIPVLTLMFLTAEPLFRVLLTEKWMPAVPYFRLLCIAGILNTINGYNLTLVLVRGRSDLYLKLNIIEKAFVTVGLFAVVRLGIYGLLYFQVASSVVIYLINGTACGKLINYPVRLQLKNLVPVFLMALLGGLLTYYLDKHLVAQMSGPTKDVFRILALCAIYLFIYIGGFLVFRIREAQDFYDLFLKSAVQRLSPKKNI